ncbi:MAG: hypothetical protein GF355_13060 [Candidatus Eisenbacteria bacterium]|nr:hypothetical protein [Candidatus Eisenbacteria bacterium]
MKDLMQFSWGVPIRGYTWIDARRITGLRFGPQDERFLSPGPTSQWRAYNPLQDRPALFRNFAELDPSEETVQAFADEHGALGLDRDIGIPRGEGRAHSRGELLSTWTKEVTFMNHALRVWDALRSGASDDLRRWFHLKRQRDVAVVEYTPDEEWPLGVPQISVQYTTGEAGDHAKFLPPGVSDRRGDPGTSVEQVPSDPYDLGLAFLQESLNRQLRNRLGCSVQTITESTRPVPLGLHIIPKSLLGAMWLQLARAIEDETRFQRCPQCGTWFKLPNKARRSSTTYCSPACRVRTYRDRQAQARKLAAEGASPEEIAAKLNSTAETVSSWIASEEKRPIREATKSSGGKRSGTRGRKP